MNGLRDSPRKDVDTTRNFGETRHLDADSSVRRRQIIIARNKLSVSVTHMTTVLHDKSLTIFFMNIHRKKTPLDIFRLRDILHK